MNGVLRGLTLATLLLAVGAHAQSPAPSTRKPVEMKASGTPGKATDGKSAPPLTLKPSGELAPVAK